MLHVVTLAVPSRYRMGPLAYWESPYDPEPTGLLFPPVNKNISQFIII
jgi:hypothetical protein